MAPRRRRQIAIQVPDELPGRIHAAAAAQRRTATSLLLEWIEAGLTGAAAAPAAAPAPADLEARLQTLEAAVLALRRPGPAPADGPPPPTAEAALAPLQPGAPITTAELAERTGTSRAAWNNWANPDRIGAVRCHSTAGNWRLIGRLAPPRGGPPRWLWEAV